MEQTLVFVNLGFCYKEQFKKGASMFGREILKILVSCLLIGCFLVGNITYAYASSSETSTNSDPYENKTELSEEEIQPSEEGAHNSEENLQTSEGNDTQTSKDNKTKSSENADAQLSEETETNSSENTEMGSSQYTKTEITEYNIEHSEYTQIENNRYIQKESEDTGSSKSSKQAPPSASVSLHGEKTEVVSGEDILLKLSAVNLITKPTMHVQVIIIPPSGMMVSSSEFVQSGAGQYTTTYELEPGQGRDIEVRIESSQVGDFNVEGRVVYYFGEDIQNAEDYTLDLPIKVKASSDSPEKAIPGFGVVSVLSVLMGVSILIRKKV